MTKRSGRDAESRPLDILGISEPEERAYRRLLAHPRATASELAQSLALAVAKAQRVLDAIEAKGLATHSPERPRRYIPVSPDVALEAFALGRQEELRRAREAIGELQEQVATAQPHGEHEQTVELITSPEAASRTFEQLHRSAQREVVALVRPPLLISRLDVPPSQDQLAQREAQSRGVRYRGIMDSTFLALPGALRAVRDEIKSGQDARVIPELPFKMFLADQRLAFIPLRLEQARSPVLLVRSSALVDALYALFEILWKQATPISFTRSGELENREAESPLPREAQDLISLLATGLNDKGIAYELGISASTLNRRITEIMKALNVRTRFQLGWVADRRLSDSIEDE